MTLYRATENGILPLTDEEQATVLAEHEEYLSKAPLRKAAAIREQRNTLLAESDWTQLADCPLDPDGKMIWALYRETLRMVPQQEGFPETVNWPPKP